MPASRDSRVYSCKCPTPRLTPPSWQPFMPPDQALTPNTLAAFTYDVCAMLSSLFSKKDDTMASTVLQLQESPTDVTAKLYGLQIVHSKALLILP